jgi:aspartate aminotransferase
MPALGNTMKKPLSSILEGIAPSITMGITSKVTELRRQGITVYSLGAGEPDFPVHEKAKLASIEAVAGNMSKYGSVEGLIELREEICRKFESENSVSYSTDEIIVTSGAKQGLFTAIQALCSPGDEIIIPVPAWVSYVEMAKAAGAVPVTVNTSKESGFKLSAGQLKAALTPKSKAIIINSPANPTGAVYSAEELKAIAEICIAEGIYIISDEIYEKFLFGSSEHVSIASFSEEAKDITLSVNGFSKAYAMPGWRVGYIGANREVINAISTLQGHCISHTSIVSQYAALAALSLGEGYIQEIVAEYSARRELVLGFLAEHDIWCPEPDGAFYALCDIQKYLEKGGFLTSSEFCEALLAGSQVACIPGEYFFADGYMRISYACSRETLATALSRIGDFIVNL